MLVRNREPMQASVGGLANSVYAVARPFPVRGRLPRGEEEGWDGPQVAVSGIDLCVARFGSDPNAIGRTIQLNDSIREVIGVMPPHVGFPSNETDLWTPMQLDPESRSWSLGHRVIGRLSLGATLESAAAHARDPTPLLAEPRDPPHRLVTAYAGLANVQTLEERTVGDSRSGAVAWWDPPPRSQPGCVVGFFDELTAPMSPARRRILRADSWLSLMEITLGEGPKCQPTSGLGTSTP